MNKNYLCLSAIIFFFSAIASAQLSPIVITEFMADPAAVSDASGEWFEIANISPNQVDMNGWHIKDSGTNNHTISGSFILNPGAVRVLGNNIDNLTNGGVTVDYQYSSFTLANSSDEIIIVDLGGNVVDSVAYTSTTPGKSWNLDPTHWTPIDNDNFSNWCLSTTPYGSGDLGTPGANNITCASGISSFSPDSTYSIRTTADELLIHCKIITGKQHWDITDLSGRIILSGTIAEQQVDIAIPIKELATGMYSFRFVGNRAAKFIVNEQ